MDGRSDDRNLVGDYPPKSHMLRDLGISLQNEDRRSTGWISVVPEICSDSGAAQTGVLATLVDVIGGSLALRTVYPDWIATSSLSLYVSELARLGVVTVSGSVLRAGTSTIVAEVRIYQETNGARKQSFPIGVAFMSFARLQRREDTLKVDFKELPNEVYSFATEDSGLTQTYLDQAGIRVVDEKAGIIELDMSGYVKNSINCLQGGMVASLIDIAGQCVAREISGRSMATVDMSIHYLSQGKTGPFRTKSTLLRSTIDTVLTQIEVLDIGAQNSLIAMATNTSVSSVGKQEP